MPIVKNIKHHNCQIAIWDMSEPIDYLINLSQNLDISKFKTEKRKKEILCSRLLLNEFLPNNSIYYNKYGAPEIKDNHFISISHSKNLTAIIISKEKSGLDIEKISPKVLRLSPKFISKNHHKNLSKEKATIIWCSKEAIYKKHQKGNVNFINDIKINPFIVEDKGQIIANFKNEKLTLNYEKIDTHFLVYVCT